MKNRYNPFGKREYVPTTVQVKCKCGNIMTIRTKEQTHTEPCWGKSCTRTIKVTLGMGKNNLSCYIVESGKRDEKVMPVSVVQ